jgi:hypothetical protein
LQQFISALDVLIIERAAHYGYFFGFFSVPVLDPENFSERKPQLFRGNYGIIGHFKP